MSDIEPTLARRAAVATILSHRGDALLVTGLGSATWDAAAAGDDPLNFYTWGGMGGALMVGLGLALARPERRVLVLTGDGEMLMGMGSLATAAVAQPPNLAVAVLDNERYGETGQQATHTAYGVDLAAVAAATGIAHTATVRTVAELEAVASELFTAPGPRFYVVKIAPGSPPLSLPERDGAYLKGRFRKALVGSLD